MFNKIFKRINNNYSNYFKIFFFLRYIFTIFLISIFIFLLIPKFFNYEKKREAIEEYLLSYYDLEIVDYRSIQFKILPSPSLSIDNIDFKVRNKPILFSTEKFNIFLKFKNIYNYEDFSAKSISLTNNKIILDIAETKNFFNYFAEFKNKLKIKNLNLILKRKENSILEIKKINFSNYGYNKYKIDGQVFNKKFKAHLRNEKKNIDFKILNTGIVANFQFDKKNSIKKISGLSKITLLNNYFKFNFNFSDNQIEITKSNFRNKDLSISFDSIISTNPFYFLKSDIDIRDINKKLINKINLKNILRNKEIIKKINGNNTINYKSNKYRSNFIKRYSIESKIANGRIGFSSQILITGGNIKCKGDSLLIDEYPRLNFICLFNIEDKKKLFRALSISKNINTDKINLNVDGSINLFNKKINFKNIYVENSYFAKEEDLKYFKDKTESFLIDDSLFEIFKKNKIKNFLLEII